MLTSDGVNGHFRGCSVLLYRQYESTCIHLNREENTLAGVPSELPTGYSQHYFKFSVQKHVLLLFIFRFVSVRNCPCEYSTEKVTHHKYNKNVYNKNDSSTNVP